jgi:hypothetical protein
MYILIISQPTRTQNYFEVIIPFHLLIKTPIMLPILTHSSTHHNRAKDPKIGNALHASSTVNANDLSVNPVTVLGGKEADDAGNVHWLANTVVRRPCACKLVDLVVAELVASGNVLAAYGVVHVGLDTTGCYAVDSNLFLASVCGVVRCCSSCRAIALTYRWPCTW